MADPTLPITNESGASITIESDDKKKAETLAKDEEKSLGRALLLSASFREHVRAGRVSFGAIPADEPSRSLGVEVMRFLLGALAPDMISVARSMPEARGSLAEKRTGYNDAWKATKALLERGNGLQDGAKALYDASVQYLTPKAATDAKAEAQQALAELDAEFLETANGDEPLTPEQLDEYNAARKAAVDALASAEAALKTATAVLAGEFGGVQRALEGAKEKLGELDPGDIGAQIAAW